MSFYLLNFFYRNDYFYSVFFFNIKFSQTSEESFHDDLDESINAKIPTIVDDIHEITLGPNAKPLNDLENETVISHPESVESKTTLPCQDPKVTSEESHLDEKIRIYLKQECMEKTKLDIPKVHCKVKILNGYLI